MNHEPPVPEANQSPYPIAEPPHNAAAALPPVRETSKTNDDGLVDRGALIGIAAAVGLTALAIGGWLLQRDSRKPVRRRAKAPRSKAGGTRKTKAKS